MTTQLKNEWIALEERYHQKHKEISKDKRSTILSQMTFCSDGVIIKKFIDLNEQVGITVQNFNETIEEVKANNSTTLVNEIHLLEVKEFGMDEIEKYTPEVLVNTSNK